MRVVLVGENPVVPSGFGMQMNMLARGLARREHDVYVIANNPPAFFDDEIKVIYTGGICEDIKALDRLIWKFKPDTCVLFYFTQFLRATADLIETVKNCPTYLWLPWEGSSLPDEKEKYFVGVPNDHIVHLSEFGRLLWQPVNRSKHVIGHMYYPEIFNLGETNRNWLRRKWSMNFRFPIFEDAVVILNVDRNIWHKRWDLTFDYLSQLKSLVSNLPVQLIAHTVRHERSQQLASDLEKLAKLYGIWENVCFTDFEWRKGLTRHDLAELYQLCDVRVSTSQGEGFGIPAIEAAACGCAQTVNRCTTMPELLGADYRGLVEPAATEERLGSLWKVPDTQNMVRNTVDWLNLKKDREKELVAVAESVRSRFSWGRVIDQWENLLKEGAADSQKCYYEAKWGWTNRHRMRDYFKKLAVVLKRLVKGGKVLEIGSFDGMFVQACIESGIEVQGVATDAVAYDRICMYLPYLTEFIGLYESGSDFPKANILVMTDVKCHVLWSANALKEYDWIVNRGDWCFVFNTEYVRRFDLEKIVQTSFDKEFAHEIWQRGQDTASVPIGFTEK